MTLLAGKGVGNTSDSIKITENADSAVITPIPNKEEIVVGGVGGPLEKRRKTRSNILRSSSEKRKVAHGKSSQENIMDVSYSLSSPESEQDKDKKAHNDDDITLIKVVPSEEKKRKLSVDDGINVEIIRSLENGTVVNNTEVKNQTTKLKANVDVDVDEDNDDGDDDDDDNDGDDDDDDRDDDEDDDDDDDDNDDDDDAVCVTMGQENKKSVNGTSDPNFDATKVLEWKDGLGSLPGSTLKVRISFYLLFWITENSRNIENTFNALNC